jgi:rhodanese-related sulfurtransferase/thiol-disulfide isomerase/thioredoxin
MKFAPGVSSASNWLLNVVSLICCGCILWQFLHRSQVPTRVQVGSRLDLPYLAAYEGKKTVILALSAYCPFCKAEAEFYRALATAAKAGCFGLVALLPQPHEVISRSLHSLGLEQGVDVRQEDLRRVGASVTPTLIVLDTNGTVLNVWKGQLSGSQEAEVSDSIGIQYRPTTPAAAAASTAPALPVVDVILLRRIMSRPAVIVDVRPREEFAAGHIRHALNIPYDEIDARSGHELPPDKPLLVYCYSPQEVFPSFSCGLADRVLRWRGFRDIRYIHADLTQLGKEGVPVIDPEHN